MNRLTKTALAGGALALGAWVAWGSYSSRSAEEVPYERVREIDGVELRRYPRTVLVETTASDQRTAFRRLFRYISGENERQDEVSMTAPVRSDGSDGESVSMTAPVRSDDADGSGTRMAFYLPAEYGPESAPVPTESTVRLVVEPPKTVAVVGFSWYAPGWRVERLEAQLLSTLDGAGIEPTAEPSLLRYDDPWTPPFMRRNEVAVEVAGAD
ncbi:SOUL family heme-binding protein [Haloarchaeobius iranensis]|uniref:SOUL heme-binding protein n=1 Tax=Haloarchaeobius iranensis TaxID=996166 RepID=A0A1G9TYF2_9EURY|nr:heme-binding protein [Haloarchaeobius iranensis]SDM52747.1 SOUL heme-binding protein [Haloarchaeobius iranensis]